MKRRQTIKHYLGVDPGQHGGMAVVRSDGEPLIWTRMPQGTARIADWINGACQQYPRVVLVVEKSQAMPKQGISSAFRYGAHFGAFEALAVLLRLPYHEVPPSTWKKSMGVTSIKRESIDLCRRIFPSVDLVLPGCSKEHDGIAEALLVAEWARRKGL